MKKVLRIIVSILFLCLVIASIIIFFVALKEESNKKDNLDIGFGIFMVLYIPFFVSEISAYFDMIYFLRDKENKKLYKTILRSITLFLSISIMSIAIVLPRSTVNLKNLEFIFLALIGAQILTKLTFYTVYCFKETEFE